MHHHPSRKHNSPVRNHVALHAPAPRWHSPTLRSGNGGCSLARHHFATPTSTYLAARPASHHQPFEIALHVLPERFHAHRPQLQSTAHLHPAKTHKTRQSHSTRRPHTPQPQSAAFPPAPASARALHG